MDTALRSTWNHRYLTKKQAYLYAAQSPIYRLRHRLSFISVQYLAYYLLSRLRCSRQVYADKSGISVMALNELSTYLRFLGGGSNARHCVSWLCEQSNSIMWCRQLKTAISKSMRWYYKLGVFLVQTPNSCLVYSHSNFQSGDLIRYIVKEDQTISGNK